MRPSCPHLTAATINRHQPNLHPSPLPPQLILTHVQSLDAEKMRPSPPHLTAVTMSEWLLMLSTFCRECASHTCPHKAAGTRVVEGEGSGAGVVMS